MNNEITKRLLYNAKANQSIYDAKVNLKFGASIQKGHVFNNSFGDENPSNNPLFCFLTNLSNDNTINKGKKNTKSSSSDFINKKTLKNDGFKSFNIPRITTQMKKNNSDFLSKSIINNHYKNMEKSVKVGEKLYSKLNHSKKEAYNSLKSICDDHNTKLKTNFMRSINSFGALPSIDEYKKPNKAIVKHRFFNKKMGAKYEPNDYYYPVHNLKKRNDFGSPYLN